MWHGLHHRGAHRDGLRRPEMPFDEALAHRGLGAARPVTSRRRSSFMQRNSSPRAATGRGVCGWRGRPTGWRTTRSSPCSARSRSPSRSSILEPQLGTPRSRRRPPRPGRPLTSPSWEAESFEFHGERGARATASATTRSRWPAGGGPVRGSTRCSTRRTSAGAARDGRAAGPDVARTCTQERRRPPVGAEQAASGRRVHVGCDGVPRSSCGGARRHPAAEVLVEHDLADPHGVGGDLDALVLADEFEALLEGHLLGGFIVWKLLRGGGANVGVVLLLARC